MRSLTRRGSLARIASVAVMAVVLAGCSAAANQGGHAASSGNQLEANYQPLKVDFQPADHATGVSPDTVVKIVAQNGTLHDVNVHAAGDTTPLTGTLSNDKTSWTASTGLMPGAQYQASAAALSANGSSINATASFSTTGGTRLITTANPGDGETVGIGMPIKLVFNTSVPGADQYALVSRIHVTSNPPQDGAWHWFSPWEVHYRPSVFWQPHTTVTVQADLQGANAGNNYFGYANWSETFTVGDSHLSKIDHNTEMMQVFTNGQLDHTIPVSLGKAGFPTLGGTLVVWYKAQKVRMNSCTSGIACSGANYYNEDVYWDTAISTDGFFIHDAYWDIPAQGHYDFSHGCVNVAPDNAIWFYNYSLKGDVVQIANTGRIADAGDGEGDWQLSFDQYPNSGGAPTTPPKATSGGI